MASVYQRFSENVQVRIFEQLFSAIAVQPDFRCVDVGCGTGNGTERLARMLDERGSVVAFDPEVDRIRCARENQSDPMITYHVGKGSDLLSFVGSGELDLAISTSVIHWMDNAEKFSTMDAIFRALKPGARFCFTVTLRLPVNHEGACASLPPEMSGKIRTNMFFEDEEFYDKMIANSPFKLVSKSRFKPVVFGGTGDEYLQWMAASIHFLDYEKLLENYRNGLEGNVYTLQMDDEGNVVHSTPVVFYYLQKTA